MSHSENLKVPKGDYGYDLTFTCKNADGTTRDMSSYTTIYFKVWAEGTPAVLLVNGECDVDVTNKYIVTYPVEDGDFVSAGKFVYEIEATTATIVESTDSRYIIVEESG